MDGLMEGGRERERIEKEKRGMEVWGKVKRERGKREEGWIGKDWRVEVKDGREKVGVRKDKDLRRGTGWKRRGYGGRDVNVRGREKREGRRKGREEDLGIKGERRVCALF